MKSEKAYKHLAKAIIERALKDMQDFENINELLDLVDFFEGYPSHFNMLCELADLSIEKILQGYFTIKEQRHISHFKPSSYIDEMVQPGWQEIVTGTDRKNKKHFYCSISMCAAAIKTTPQRVRALIRTGNERNGVTYSITRVPKKSRFANLTQKTKKRIV